MSSCDLAVRWGWKCKNPELDKFHNPSRCRVAATYGLLLFAKEVQMQRFPSSLVISATARHATVLTCSTHRTLDWVIFRAGRNCRICLVKTMVLAVNDWISACCCWFGLGWQRTNMQPWLAALVHFMRRRPVAFLGRAHLVSPHSSFTISTSESAASCFNIHVLSPTNGNLLEWFNDSALAGCERGGTLTAWETVG